RNLRGENAGGRRGQCGSAVTHDLARQTEHRGRLPASTDQRDGIAGGDAEGFSERELGRFSGDDGIAGRLTTARQRAHGRMVLYPDDVRATVVYSAAAHTEPVCCARRAWPRIGPESHRHHEAGLEAVPAATSRGR